MHNSVFETSWWLDAVADTNWDQVTINDSDKLVARLPYATRNLAGIWTQITMPPLTQTLGPWLAEFEGKRQKVTSIQYELIQKLFEQLPIYDDLRIQTHASLDNWLPLYWKGFKQTTKYSYVLNDLSDLDQIYAGFESNVRGKIRKAEKNVEILTDEDILTNQKLGITPLAKLSEETYTRQKIDNPVSQSTLESAYTAAKTRDQGKAWYAINKYSEIIAGTLCIWDDKSMFHIVSAANDEGRKSGAQALLIWNEIQHAASVTACFDFEGSMIQPIEKFFRQFGATPQPYFELRHTPNKLLRGLRAMQSLR